MSLRDTLETVARMKGSPPDGLVNPNQLPVIFVDVWQSFHMLNNSRQSGLNGAQAISYQEIMAYCQLTNHKLSQLELEALRRLDVLKLNNANKKG